MTNFDSARKNEQPILFGKQACEPLNTDSNTEPTDASKSENAQLLKLIDFAQLNSLFEPFLIAMGLPVYMTDLNGTVLVSSNYLTRCLDSDSHLVAQLNTGKAYASHQCSHGLVNCAAPVVVEGCHLANLFTGQCVVEQPDIDIIDREKLPVIMGLLISWTQQIAARSLAEQRAIAELAIAKEKAELANQEKNAFIAHISHKLRSPLNAVMGFSQLMLQTENLPGEHYENASIIYNSGKDLLTLINTAVAGVENSPKESRQESQTESLLSTHHFQVMPTAWLTRLSDAALEADKTLVIALIQDIPSTEVFLIERLTRLARQFQFEHILDLIEPLISNN
jgi:hypothetical protein